MDNFFFDFHRRKNFQSKKSTKIQKKWTKILAKIRDKPEFFCPIFKLIFLYFLQVFQPRISNVSASVFTTFPFLMSPYDNDLGAIRCVWLMKCLSVFDECASVFEYQIAVHKGGQYLKEWMSVEFIEEVHNCVGAKRRGTDDHVLLRLGPVDAFFQFPGVKIVWCKIEVTSASGERCWIRFSGSKASSESAFGASFLGCAAHSIQRIRRIIVVGVIVRRGSVKKSH